MKRISTVLLIMVGIVFITILKKCCTWKIYQKFYQMTTTIYNYKNKRRGINDSLKHFYQDYNKIIMKHVVVWAFVETACVVRTLVARLFFSIFGIETNAVLGYIFTPSDMHIWLEDEDGKEMYSSPCNIKNIKRLQIRPFE